MLGFTWSWLFAAGVLVGSAAAAVLPGLAAAAVVEGMLPAAADVEGTSRGGMGLPDVAAAAAVVVEGPGMSVAAAVVPSDLMASAAAASAAARSAAVVDAVGSCRLLLLGVLLPALRLRLLLCDCEGFCSSAAFVLLGWLSHQAPGAFLVRVEDLD